MCKTHSSPCPPCDLKSINCFILWPPIAILGTCSADQTWKACYSSSELTSCCCAPMIPTTLEPSVITRGPSNIQCPPCVSKSSNCYFTDPYIPSLGFCLAGYDFYGCYELSGDITNCCCKLNIQPDCTTADLEAIKF
ncbi:unnamed protein product [Chironomus riparius]|uniref:Uncharacterized protein n=1 Tax=Chironomus riparius TaxID=315576 RepID=A0A9N9WWC9_9DIPT|nr:unnamed protein product [Chironomus riparius]